MGTGVRARLLAEEEHSVRGVGCSKDVSPSQSPRL